MKQALALIRSKAVYFVLGEWPAIVQNTLPESLKPGKKYAVAIIEVPE